MNEKQLEEFTRAEVIRELRIRIEEARSEEFLIPKIVDQIINEIEEMYAATSKI